MAVAHDADANHAGGTGTLTWNHIPVGTPRGILVLISQGTGDGTDQVTGVTYGGVSMTEVTGSPLLSTAGAEDNATYGYFLGTGIPTGTQSVSVSVNATATAKRAVSFSVTASADTTVHNTQTLDSTGVANPSVTLVVTGGATVQCYGVLHSSVNAPSMTAGANTSEVLEHDFGVDTTSWTRATATTTSNFAYGWTLASNEAAVLAVAITESSSAVAFTGKGTIANAGSGAFKLSAAAAGTGAASSAGSGAPTTLLALAGTGANANVGTGAFKDLLALAGMGANANTGSGALKALLDLAGKGTNANTGTGAFVAVLALAGSGPNANIGTGSFAALLALAGSGANSSVGTGAITAILALTGRGAASSVGLGSFTVTTIPATTTTSARTVIIYRLGKRRAVANRSHGIRQQGGTISTTPVVTSETRVTEAGEERLTEAGETRVTE